MWYIIAEAQTTQAAYAMPSFVNGYTVMVALGLIAAGAVKILLRVPRPAGDKHGFVWFPAAIGLIMGAKIPLLISHGMQAELFCNGKSLIGGLLGAYIAVRIGKWIFRQQWVGGGDAFVLPLSMGLAVGRVGCLLRGCCWGINGFPAPALEIAFHLSAFLVFLYYRRHAMFIGSWFPMYMLAYCIFRFGIEFIRTEPRVLLWLTAYQWTAACGVLIFCFELMHRRKQFRETDCVETA